MPQNIRRNSGFIATMLVVGFAAGATYACFRDRDFTLQAVSRGGFVGFVIALACATIDLVIFPRFTALPFAAQLLIKTLAFAAAGASIAILPGIISHGAAAPILADPQRLTGTIIITLVISYLANLIMAMRRVLGKDVFCWLLIGRYRTPVEEQRMFLFIDLTRSTELAEQIGHVKYHRFIHKVWCDIADVIINSRGDIYKYVGDEVIITWLLGDARLDNCWLECFFKIRESLEKRHGEYFNQFGIVPQFRASLHCGTVVAGEMGDWKREVGFIGDTVNTAARILEECKTTDRDFIVSKEVINRIADISRYAIRQMPAATLRNKTGNVTLFGVERVAVAG